MVSFSEFRPPCFMILSINILANIVNSRNLDVALHIQWMLLSKTSYVEYCLIYDRFFYIKVKIVHHKVFILIFKSNGN